MAYRTPSEGCHHCDEVAFSRCGECQGWRCLEHTVVHGPLCPECHHALQRHLGAVHAWAWRAAGVLVALPLFPYITHTVQGGWRQRTWVWGALPASLALFDAAIITALLGLALGHSLLVTRLWHARRSFHG